MFIGATVLALGYQIFMRWVDDNPERARHRPPATRPPPLPEPVRQSRAGARRLFLPSPPPCCSAAAPRSGRLQTARGALAGRLVGRLADGAGRGKGGRPRPQTEEWWRNFDDPYSTHLVAEAQRLNPNVRTAGMRIMEARAQLAIAGSLLYPQQQQVTGAVLRTGTEASSGPDSTLTAYNIGFGVGWEIDFWGKFRRSIEAADAGYFASIAQYDDLQVLIAAQAASFYAAIRTLELRLTSPTRTPRCRSAAWRSPNGCSSTATTPNSTCSRRSRSTSARSPRFRRSRAACARRRTR
jgi:hypothetical protein